MDIPTSTKIITPNQSQVNRPLHRLISFMNPINFRTHLIILSLNLHKLSQLLVLVVFSRKTPSFQTHTSELDTRIH